MGPCFSGNRRRRFNCRKLSLCPLFIFSLLRLFLVHFKCLHTSLARRARSNYCLCLRGLLLPITEWDGVNRAKSESRHWSRLFQVEGGEERSLPRRPLLGSRVLIIFSGPNYLEERRCAPSLFLPITPHPKGAKFSSNPAKPARIGRFLRE